MTDINIILSNLKVFHYSPWEEDKLEECKKLLADMSKEELRTIAYVGRNSVSSVGQNQSLTSLLN